MIQSSPTIFILSGGIGSSGEQLVNTVLAQFPGASVNLVMVGSVRQEEQILATLSQAQAAVGLVVHTLVEAPLRSLLVQEAQRLGVPAVDLMGPLIQWLSQALDRQPLGKPGLYRQLNRQYFERVAAIDFTMAHDDGKSPEGWDQAEFVLVGVSRVGKTPLSLYLAVLGWKVANVPLVPQLPVPEALFRLDPRRVFGLTIDSDQLLGYRLKRQSGLGVSGASDYVDPEGIEIELREANKVFQRGKFEIIDMTSRTIELGADEILRRASPRR
jgi:hypothetical protein